VSNAYSGSGALKADFTRTGIRTREGALRDGMNSVTRYLKNNYFDGPRQVRSFSPFSKFTALLTETSQDAFDLMTGAWVARRMPSMSAALVLDRRPLLIRSVSHHLSVI
jgi:hypothetical protein